MGFDQKKNVEALKAPPGRERAIFSENLCEELEIIDLCLPSGRHVIL